MTGEKKLLGTAVAAALIASTIGLPSLADTNNTNNCPGKKLEVNTAPMSDLERKYFELKTQVDRLMEPSDRFAFPWLAEPFAWDSMVGGIDSFGKKMEQLAGHSLMLDTHWGGYLPRMKTSQTDKQVKITAEVPGIDENNLDVSVQGDTITIKGLKEDSSEAKDESKRSTGRRYGTFERTMKLPYAVDSEKAEAILKNGVLTVTVPKLPGQQAEGKKIAIRRE